MLAQCLTLQALQLHRGCWLESPDWLESGSHIHTERWPGQTLPVIGCDTLSLRRQANPSEYFRSRGAYETSSFRWRTQATSHHKRHAMRSLPDYWKSLTTLNAVELFQCIQSSQTRTVGLFSRGSTAGMGAASLTRPHPSTHSRVQENLTELTLSCGGLKRRLEDDQITEGHPPLLMLRCYRTTGTILAMTLKDIEQEALGLSETERAELILSLMRTLGMPEAEIEDDEVFRRDAELENGSVEPMLHEEFVRRVREKRGR